MRTCARSPRARMRARASRRCSRAFADITILPTAIRRTRSFATATSSSSLRRTALRCRRRASSLPRAFESSIWPPTSGLPIPPSSSAGTRCRTRVRSFSPRRHTAFPKSIAKRGAARKAELSLTFAETSDNFAAYGVPRHRHLAEIVQGLNRASREPVRVTFTPHLTPIIRGIFATLYAPLRNPDADLQALYEKRYAGEPFIDVMPPGSLPDTRSVRASNVLRIAVHRPDSDLALVMAVEDNLVKGAAGQAIQNMNLMFGLPETTGLVQVPVAP